MERNEDQPIVDGGTPVETPPVVVNAAEAATSSPAAGETDPELVALALWREGRRDEALEILERYLASEKRRATQGASAWTLADLRALAAGPPQLPPAPGVRPAPAILDLVPEPVTASRTIVPARPEARTAEARRRLSPTAMLAAALGVALVIGFAAGAVVWRAGAPIVADIAGSADGAGDLSAASFDMPPAPVLEAPAAAVAEPDPEPPAAADEPGSVGALATSEGPPGEAEPSPEVADEPPPELEEPQSVEEASLEPPPEFDLAPPPEEADADIVPPPSPRLPAARRTPPRYSETLAERRAWAEEYAARRRAQAERRAAALERRRPPPGPPPPLRYSRRVLQLP